MKPTILLVAVILLLSHKAFPQEWAVVNGKARMQTILQVEGHNANDIYRHINQWLIQEFKNPESIVRARLENSFLRGECYYPNLLQIGSLTSAHFQYTFTFDIEDGRTRFTMTNAVITYPFGADDADRSFPLEEYLLNKKRKSGDYTDQVLKAVQTLTDSLVLSLNKFLHDETKEREDKW